MDIKASILWGLIGLAAGGGGYGFYVKTMGKAAFNETQAYALYGQCMTLQATVSNPSNIPKAKALLNKIDEKLPNIEKSDVIVKITTAAAGEKSNLPSGFGPLLKDCVTGLKREIKNSESSL